jgi:hypothetical protein
MSNEQSKSWVKVAQDYLPSGDAPTPLTAGGKGAKTPAPKKDQIFGSDKNKKGSASSSKSASKVKFSDRVETALKNKVEEHNKKAKKGRKTSLATLKAVYRRGAGAFSTSHRPGMTRDRWAMARVNAFLKLLTSGKPANSAYKTDNDLLPSSHPKSTKKSNSAITASALVPEEQDLANALLEVVAKHGKFDQDGTGVWAGYTPANENEDADIGVICKNCVFYAEDEQGNDVCQIIALPIEDLGKCRLAVIPDGLVDPSKERDLEEASYIAAEYAADMELSVDVSDKSMFSNPEDAIISLTEISGLGYEAEFAIKASWMRAVKNGRDPFSAAKELATLTYDSKDSDLLPVREESTAL